MTESEPRNGPTEGSLAFAFEHCEALVREGDPDRYFATLFAPVSVPAASLRARRLQPHRCARARRSHSNPVAGEIRLQWWRDALQGEARGDVKANPVAAALDDAIVASAGSGASPSST